MNRIFGYLIIIAGIFIGCGPPEGGKVYKLTDYHWAALEEANFARTEPQKYAKERLTPGSTAYNDMLSRSPVPAMKLSRVLVAAATDYAKYSVDNRHWGHDDLEGRSPHQRYSEDHNYHWAWLENLLLYLGNGEFGNAYDAQAGRNAVHAWMTSDGHRRSLMYRDNIVMGIGWWTDNDQPRYDGFNNSSIMIEAKGECNQSCKNARHWLLQVQIFGVKPDPMPEKEIVQKCDRMSDYKHSDFQLKVFNQINVLRKNPLLYANSKYKDKNDDNYKRIASYSPAEPLVLLPVLSHMAALRAHANIHGYNTELPNILAMKHGYDYWSTEVYHGFGRFYSPGADFAFNHLIRSYLPTVMNPELKTLGFHRHKPNKTGYSTVHYEFGYKNDKQGCDDRF